MIVSGIKLGLPAHMFGLSVLDIAIVLTYFVAVLGTGLWAGRQETDTRDFIVGGRRIPWIAVLFSIIATEISAVTFLSVPGVGYSENLNYLQFGMGSIVGRFVVAFLFIPAFFRWDCLTVYGYLAERFGRRTRTAATALFLVSRVMGSALRLSLAAIGFHVILGISFPVVLTVFTLLAIIYTYWGGIKAVVWTDVVQATVFIGGGFAVLIYIASQVGVGHIFEVAAAHERLDLLRLVPDPGSGWLGWLNDPGIFFLAFLNGLMMTTASLGTDQDLTQRVLTCRNPREAARSLVWSGFLGIPVAALFLFVGVGLFAYYQPTGGAGLPLTSEGIINASRVFPHFIGEVLPAGLKGLLLAGVFAAAMSSIDSAMSALSSSAIVDLYKPLFRPQSTEAHLLKAARVAVLVFGLLLWVIAMQFRHADDFLWLALQLAGIPASALLGIFLAGLCTRTRGNDAWNLCAMSAGFLLSSALFFMIRWEIIDLAWPWMILFGTAATFGLAILPRQEPQVIP